MHSLNLQDYEEIPTTALVASKIIADMWIKLGRPQTPFTKSGQKMMDIIIAVWEDLYPVEMKVWYGERRDYKLNEMTISEQVKKGTGRSLASYPFPIYQMMKRVFKDFNPGERKNCLKMVKQWPMFLFANKA